MDVFEQKRKSAAMLSPDKLSEELFNFIRSIESEMVRLNKEQIQERSKDVYGDALGFYSKATEVITGGRKKAGEPYDMNDTGKFLSGFYAKIQNEMVVFGSTDPKTDEVLDNPNLLSKELFGLTDDDLDKVIQNKILPLYLDYTKKIIES